MCLKRPSDLLNDFGLNILDATSFSTERYSPSNHDARETSTTFVTHGEHQKISHVQETAMRTSNFCKIAHRTDEFGELTMSSPPNVSYRVTSMSSCRFLRGIIDVSCDLENAALRSSRI